MEKILEGIAKHKIVVIMRKVAGDKILPVTQALYDGGIRMIEVTYDQSSANHLEETGGAIKAIANAFKGRMHVGAGTVLTAAQASSAKDHGAEFIVSPNTDEEVIVHTRKLGMVSIPGAFTPSEVVLAHKYGAHYVKLFPGGDLGPGYLKSITAPISHIPILVVGGVNAENMKDFFKAGAAGFGIGSNIVSQKLIDEGAYDKLKELALTYTKQIGR